MPKAKSKNKGNVIDNEEMIDLIHDHLYAQTPTILAAIWELIDRNVEVVPDLQKKEYRLLSAGAVIINEYQMRALQSIALDVDGCRYEDLMLRFGFLRASGASGTEALRFLEHVVDFKRKGIAL